MMKSKSTSLLLEDENMKLTRTQLKEYIHKVVRQQLREQQEPPYPSRDTARDEDLNKAEQAINKWFADNEKSGKFQKSMLDYAMEVLQENAEGDYKWIPNEQEAVQTMFDKFDFYWFEELLESVADDFRDVGIDEIIEKHEEFRTKHSQHARRICDRYAKELFDEAADQLDEMYMDPYELRGVSRRDFFTSN